MGAILHWPDKEWLSEAVRQTIESIIDDHGLLPDQWTGQHVIMVPTPNAQVEEQKSRTNITLWSAYNSDNEEEDLPLLIQKTVVAEYGRGNIGHKPVTTEPNYGYKVQQAAAQLGLPHVPLPFRYITDPALERRITFMEPIDENTQNMQLLFLKSIDEELQVSQHPTMLAGQLDTYRQMRQNLRTESIKALAVLQNTMMFAYLAKDTMQNPDVHMVNVDKHWGLLKHQHPDAMANRLTGSIASSLVWANDREKMSKSLASGREQNKMFIAFLGRHFQDRTAKYTMPLFRYTRRIAPTRKSLDVLLADKNGHAFAATFTHGDYFKGNVMGASSNTMSTPRICILDFDKSEIGLGLGDLVTYLCGPEEVFCQEDAREESLRTYLRSNIAIKDALRTHKEDLLSAKDRHSATQVHARVRNTFEESLDKFEQQLLPGEFEDASRRRFKLLLPLEYQVMLGVVHLKQMRDPQAYDRRMNQRISTNTGKFKRSKYFDNDSTIDRHLRMIKLGFSEAQDDLRSGSASDVEAANALNAYLDYLNSSNVDYLASLSKVAKNQA